MRLPAARGSVWGQTLCVAQITWSAGLLTSWQMWPTIWLWRGLSSAAWRRPRPPPSAHEHQARVFLAKTGFCSERHGSQRVREFVVQSFSAAPLEPPESRSHNGARSQELAALPDSEADAAESHERRVHFHVCTGRNVGISRGHERDIRGRQARNEGAQADAEERVLGKRRRRGRHALAREAEGL